MKKTLWIALILVLVCVLALSACHGESGSGSNTKETTNASTLESTTKETAEHVHNFGEWVTIKEASKTEDGQKSRTCSGCSATETETIPATGSVGLVYTVNSDGQSCIITGIGSCTDTNIVIPKKINGYAVTSIGDYAFALCESLTSITIPNSITSIGKAAFFCCTSLPSITIPNSVTSIGEVAFQGCESLMSVVIPDSGVSIGMFAFSGCTSLPSITIPDSVTAIGMFAFEGCTSLTTVTIGGPDTSIGDLAFGQCPNLTTIQFQGTKAQWRAINGLGLFSIGGHTVHCTDGDIVE